MSFDEKAFAKENEGLSQEDLRQKARKIEAQIVTEKQKLSRMYLVREKIEKLEADILYHSSELKILKKLKTVATREVVVICSL